MTKGATVTPQMPPTGWQKLIRFLHAFWNKDGKSPKSWSTRSAILALMLTGAVGAFLLYLPRPVSELRFLAPALIILWVLFYVWLISLDPVNRLYRCLVFIVGWTAIAMGLGGFSLVIDFGALAAQADIDGISGTYELKSGLPPLVMLGGGLALSLIMLLAIRSANGRS